MRGYRVRYAPEAAGRIRKLHPEIKKQIRAAADRLIQSPYEGHALQQELSGLRSRRVGRHRILYRISESEGTIDILLVGPRRDIYEELRVLAARLRDGGQEESGG